MLPEKVDDDVLVAASRAARAWSKTLRDWFEICWWIRWAAVRLFKAADSWEEMLRSDSDQASGTLSRSILEDMSTTGPELGVVAAVDVMEGESMERHEVEGEDDEDEGDGLVVGERGKEGEE